MTDPNTPGLIHLPQPTPGLERFIAAWVIPGPPTFVVDPGPRASIRLLANELHSRGIDRVDYVLLTHIHIDHAGGLGPFLERFPGARAVCHAAGMPHLADPSRLWAGSRKTLGELAAVYGPIEPSPIERLLPHDRCDIAGLEIIETPGHAPHHLSFVLGGRLYAGESAGVHLPFSEGLYLRPPTPPRFFFDQAVASVDRMQALPDLPIHFGHLGSHPSSREILARYRRQLHLWLGIAAEARTGCPDRPREEAERMLLARDPLLRLFPKIPPEEQARERGFIRTSLDGFLGYIESAGR